MNGKPLICGGFNGTHSFQDCFFVQGNINQNISMTQIRSFATAVVLQGKAYCNKVHRQINIYIFHWVGGVAINDKGQKWVIF